jgi:hypothetical protein
MSQEPEDSKPKLNLNISYDGTSSCFRWSKVYDENADATLNVGNDRYHCES